jgi:hypothetical protein
MRYRSTARFLLEGIEGVLVALLVFVSWPLSRRWLRDWGSTPDERERGWPGDALVSSPRATSTRAVHVAAPAATVWPWVVQVGLGRAGFYSYELLERAAGIPVKNVECIVPALQTLAIGDAIELHPDVPRVPVGALEPARHVCFGGAHDLAPGPRRSWSIYLVPQSPSACRLVLRGCVEVPEASSWLARIGRAFEQPLDLVMEQRMLRTVRRLSEAA